MEHANGKDHWMNPNTFMNLKPRKKQLQDYTMAFWFKAMSFMDCHSGLWDLQICYLKMQECFPSAGCQEIKTRACGHNAPTARAAFKCSGEKIGHNNDKREIKSVGV